MELTFYFSLSTYIAMRNINGNKLRGHLETMVLSMLEGGPAHGFELLRRLESAGDGTLKMKEGSLYPALYRLEEAGVVTAKWEDGTSGRRGARRRYYSLTKKGHRRLAAGRKEWVEFVNVVGGIVGATA